MKDFYRLLISHPLSKPSANKKRITMYQLLLLRQSISLKRENLESFVINVPLSSAGIVSYVSKHSVGNVI